MTALQQDTAPDNPVAQFAADTVRSVAEMLLSTVLLPALRDLGVLADVTEISAGVVHITVNLGGTDNGDRPASPSATISATPPRQAETLRGLVGGVDAV